MQENVKQMLVFLQHRRHFNQPAPSYSKYLQNGTIILVEDFKKNEQELNTYDYYLKKKSQRKYVKN